MNLLLDTHVFLWLDANPEKLSETAREACSDLDNTLWLSVGSVWEMQIKIILGKLKLERTLAETIESQRTINRLRIPP